VCVREERERERKRDQLNIFIIFLCQPETKPQLQVLN
jgi:hypothetical protein